DFFRRLGETDKRWYGRLGWALQFGDNRTEARPASKRGKVCHLPSGHALKGVVPVGGADDRANDRAAVHDSRKLRKDFANLNSRNLRVDRRKLAANLCRRVKLQVEHVLVRRATPQEDIDDRFLTRRFAVGCFQSVQVGKRKRSRAEAERPDSQKAPPRSA